MRRRSSTSSTGCSVGAASHVIPNWSDDETIRPASETENPLRRAWGLEGKFVVGYSGRPVLAGWLARVQISCRPLTTVGQQPAAFPGSAFLSRALDERRLRRGYGVGSTTGPI